MADINALLWPKSVAIVGAAEDTSILRGRILNVMRMHDFAGSFHPVNRKLDKVQGLQAYPSIDAIPESVDLAVLIIPAESVADEMIRCGKAGIKAVQILASGFAEEPGEKGEAMQVRIQEIAKQYDMAVAGPNSEGFTNLVAKLCVTFSTTMEMGEQPLIPDNTNGRIAVVAQSGGVGYSFFDRGRPKELPFSYIVSTGNEACLETLQIVDHLLNDDGTDIVLMFMEDVKTPELLAPVAEKALRAGKPLIAIKVGQTEAGARAAQSHTGALAGAYEVYQAQFQRYGIIEGRDQDEIVDLAQGFSVHRNLLPAGKRVGIFTASGGAGGWMADTAAAAGLEIPELDTATRTSIDALLPPYGTSHNPVDGTAQVIRQKGYAEMSEMIAASDNVDAVIAVSSARNPVGWEHERDRLMRVGRETKKPILLWAYHLPHPDVQKLVSQAGFSIYSNLRNCATTLSAMADYRAFREDFLKPTEVKTIDVDKKEARARLDQSGPVLSEHEARHVLKTYGIGYGAGILLERAEDTAKLSIDGPAVLKVQSPEIPHKTDAGAIALNIQGKQALKAAFEMITTKARAFAPDAHIQGVSVQPMAADGVDVILGIHRDDSFGPMLMLGLGGIHVEVLKDVIFAPVPIQADEARRLIRRLKAAPILDGLRGAAPADVDALIDVIVRLSQFAADFAGEIDEIDLNPIRVHPQGEGVSLLDALIIQRRSL